MGIFTPERKKPLDMVVVVVVVFRNGKMFEVR